MSSPKNKSMLRMLLNAIGYILEQILKGSIALDKGAETVQKETEAWSKKKISELDAEHEKAVARANAKADVMRTRLAANKK